MTTVWNDVWKEALAAAVAAMPAEAAPVARRLVAARGTRVRALLAALSDDALEAASFEAELEDERAIVGDELAAMQGVARRTARRAADAAFDVVEAALVDGIALD